MAAKIVFKRARRAKAKLRLAFMSPSGHGKSKWAILVAKGISNYFLENMGRPARVAALDTESESLSIYEEDLEFDTFNLSDYDPRHYCDLIEAAQEQKYDIFIIDSLSHAWAGKNGALQLVDQVSSGSAKGNNFGAWRTVTPIHNQMVDAILTSKMHIIATMRTKCDYVQTKDSEGKTVIKKMALAPIQREGMEYEFTITADIDEQHDAVIAKTRYSAIADTKIQKRHAERFGYELAKWLYEVPGAEDIVSEQVVKPMEATQAGESERERERESESERESETESEQLSRFDILASAWVAPAPLDVIAVANTILAPVVALAPVVVLVAPQPAPVAPAPIAPAPVDDYFVSTEQVEDIENLLVLFKSTPEGLANILRKRINEKTGQPCRLISELSKVQGTEIARNIRKHLDKTTAPDQMVNQIKGMGGQDAAVAAGADWARQIDPTPVMAPDGTMPPPFAEVIAEVLAKSFAAETDDMDDFQFKNSIHQQKPKFDPNTGKLIVPTLPPVKVPD